MIISDAEKIDIMQHYIDGGEIESKYLASDEWFNCAGPSWNWSEGDYRKRIYNYPLYFECILYSSKFIVEFTGLTEGTVVQTTYSSLQIGYFEEAWQPHTDKNIWREVQKPKELDILEHLKLKFSTGDYICIGNSWFDVDKWVKKLHPSFKEKSIIEYKLIHKKHEDILNAYLKDKNVQIEWKWTGFGFTYLEEDFLETYDETNHYRIKEPKKQIVHECYRTNKKTGESEMLTKLLTDDMLNILQEDERTQYTYHKTGRSFEIKLGDK